MNQFYSFVSLFEAALLVMSHHRHDRSIMTRFTDEFVGFILFKINLLPSAHKKALILKSVLE